MRAAAVALLCATTLALANAACVKDVDSLKGLRDATDAMAEQLMKNPSPRGCPAEGKKGLATSVGTQQQFDNVYASLDILRNTHNSTLPLTIFHYGDELAEGVMDLLTQAYSNVHFVDIEPLKTALVHKCDDGEKPSGFARKALGLYHSLTSYEHVLFVDADNFFLSDPESLFETAEYKEHGSMFWPDFFGGWVNPEIYETLTWAKYKPAATADTESGQVLINTCRHQDVLEQMWTLNEHAQVTYNYMFGDKDTFRLAFALTNKLDSFYQIPSAPAGAYTTMEASAELQRLHLDAELQAGFDLLEAQYYDRCHSASPGFLVAMMQVSPNGDPIFLHRTNAEFSLMNERQIHTEFIVAPRSPKQAKELLWQMPISQGWAVCTDMTPLLTTPKMVETVENAATETLANLRMQVSLGNVVGYTDMVRGKPSEIVRAVQLAAAEALARRVGNSSNSSSNTPTPAPTATFTKVVQALTFSNLANAAAYTGAVKTVYETAYMIASNCWDTTNNARYSWAYISSSAARRAAVVTFTLRIDPTTTAGSTVAAAATTTANAITASSYTAAIATAKTELAAAGDTTDYSAITATVTNVGAATVTTESTTAPPVASPTPSASPTPTTSGATGTTFSLVTLLAVAGAARLFW